jgi:hypothetical protein
MSAMPIGAPGCPELAFCTASMLSARTAFAKSLREAMFVSYLKSEYSKKLCLLTELQPAFFISSVL